MLARILAKLRSGKAVFVVTIEGGGTKTLVQVLSKDGNALQIQHDKKWTHEARFPASNISTLTEGELVSSFKEQFSLISINNKTLLSLLPNCVVVAGMSGVGNDVSKGKVLACFNRLGLKEENIYLSGDVEVLSQFAGNPGIVVVAGTGGVCKGRNHEMAYRVGGHGPRANNDAGGGYDVAVKALVCAREHELNMQGTTRFYDDFIQGLRELAASKDASLKNVTANEFILPFNRWEFSAREIASLCPIVFEHAFKQPVADSKAIKILRKVTYTIATNICDVYEGLHAKGEMPVLLTGGLFKSKYVDNFVELISMEINAINADKGIDADTETKPAITFKVYPGNYVSELVRRELRRAMDEALNPHRLLSISGVSTEKGMGDQKTMKWRSKL